MSLTKSNLVIIVSCTCLLLVLSTAVFFPHVVDNLITGFASISSFSVGVAVSPNPNEANPVPPLEPKKNPSLGFFSIRTKSGGLTTNAGFADADYIAINATQPGAFEDYFTLHNPDKIAKEFIINFTTNFIHDLARNITINPNESTRIIIPVDTKNLEPGEYTDYIFIRSGTQQENITVYLKLSGGETGEIEAKNPEQEQPKPAVEQIQEQSQRKKPTFLNIIIVLIGITLISCIIFLFLHLRKGINVLKNEKNEKQP